MNTTLSARDWAIIAAVATIVVGLIIAAIAGWLSHRKRRTARLRTQLAAQNMTVL
jgi:membrane associated rhomboid family serine protease